MVHVKPETQEVVGFGNAYGRNRSIFDYLAQKFGVSYKVNQLIRYRDVQGNDKLVVQGNAYSRDFQNNRKTFHFTYGKFDLPIYVTHTHGYNPETGEPIVTGKEVVGFDPVYYLPFSEAQVRAFASLFDRLSLIIHTGSRKYTVTSLEEFVRPFEDLKAQVTPKPKAD
jgi:hypothetical protein